MKPAGASCVCVCVFSLVRLSVTPWTVARQAPLSKGFPGKNTGVGCCFLLQGSSHPGTEPETLSLLYLLQWQVDS